MNYMKNMKYMAMAGVLTLFASLTVTSCVDANEWETDSHYDRLFSPSSLSVDADATEAEVSWKSTSKSDYYIIEVSVDSLYGTNEPTRESSIVFGTNKNITSSPYTLTELLGGTRYFIRIKGCSSSKGDSHWTYLEKFAFSTSKENILQTVETNDKGENFIILHWDPSLTVTTIKYAEILGTDESGSNILGEEKSINLTEENKTLGEVMIDGLNASTSYQITIYNGEIARGTRTVATTAATPQGNLKVILHAGETLTQDLLNSWVSEGSVTVTFEAGAEYTLVGVDASGAPAGLTIPNGLSITLFGEAGETKPVLNIQRELILGGIHSYLRFENLTMVDKGAAYLFNQGSDASASEVTFKDCNFNDFTRSIFRCKDQKTISIDKISFENCIVTNQGKEYAFMTLDAKEYTIGSIEFTNCTFNTLAHNLVGLYNSSRGCANVNSVNITNCTFYNSIGSGKYILDAGSTEQGPTVTLTNTILSKTYTAKQGEDGTWTSASKGMRTKEVIVNNTYITADGIFGSNAIKNCIEYVNTSDKLFKDPENGDFTIIDNTISGVGDLRWYAQ